MAAGDHLVPVGDPADGARHGEDDREHVGRDADRLEDDAGVEVDIRVQLALDEVLVFQRDLFQTLGDLELRVVRHAQLLQHFVAGLFHDLGARIEVAIDAVTEAHQLERVFLVLGLVDEALDVFLGLFTDLVEHGQHGFVGAAVCRAPQCRDTGADAGERVGTGGAGQTHGRGRGVLLVVGVQHEDGVHRLGEHRVDLVLLARVAEHHVQEVLAVGEVIARVHERLTDVVLVAHGRQGRHLGDQAHGADVAFLLVGDVQVVVIEGGQATDHAAQDRHRVGVATEALEEVDDLLMHHGVVADQLGELVVFLVARQLSEQQQVAQLDVVGALGQLVDGVAAMQQHAFLAIDEGDG